MLVKQAQKALPKTKASSANASSANALSKVTPANSKKGSGLLLNLNSI
jgi:hypothetical protein